MMISRSRPDDALAALVTDPRRLDVLKAYDVCDDRPDPWFDSIADLARVIFGTPVVAIGFVDGQHEWFKTRRGLDASALPVAQSIGAHVIGHDDLVVLDGALDARFSDCPLVSGSGLRFYAGASVRAPGGHHIGTVCVMDRQPRDHFPADRLAALHGLARLVETELERRLLAERLQDAEERQRDMAEVTSDLAWATDSEHRFANFDTEAPGMSPLRPFALGRHRWDFRDAHPLKGTWADHIATLDARESFRDFEYELVTSLGEYRAMRISGRPAFDRRGQFLGYRGLSADITSHKLQERRLAANEAKYRTLVESMVDVVFTTDAAGRLTYVSDAAKAVLGADPAELIGRTIASLLHPDDRWLLVETVHAARRTPERINAFVARGGARTASMRHVEVRFRAGGEGDVGDHLISGGILRDVEARTLMEERQRDDMMKLRSIIESSGALILLVDRDMRVVLANHSFLEATGRKIEEILAARFEDVIDCNIDRAIVVRWLAHAQATRLEPVEFDNTLARGNDAPRIIRVTASPVQDETGRVNYILFLGVDETARRSAELQLLNSARLATIGQMATGMAHEVNQPLTVLQFGIEGLMSDIEDGLLRDDPAGFAETAMTALKRMEDQVSRASGIIRSMQGFAYRSDNAPPTFNASKAVGDAVGLVSEQMRLANVDLVAHIAAGLPAIAGQANRLQQVLINLFLNARDAIEEGLASGVGMRGRITVRADYRDEPNAVIIEVEDNGPGIPADVLPRLFEPFFTTKLSGKGTGLGLSISFDIVRTMGGTVDVTTAPGAGARFTLTFPVPAP